jgi:ribosomal protein S18 acetylase RimI-like enzyme
VIHYRGFRNPDPPLLAEVWNACMPGRRSVPLRVGSLTLLEYFTFAKLYFDPAGLIFALDGDRPAGVVHAGFGGAAGFAADPSVGVVCLLGVMPSHRRTGIGSELLRRAEDYLRRHGAKELLVGAMAPRNPFLFGLYGGCDSPGVLSSEQAAQPFLEKHGYTVARSCGIYRRSLDRPAGPPDPRSGGIRQRYDVLAVPYSKGGFWRESVLGPVEAVEYRLQDKHDGQVVARAVVWDMETFTQAWGETCVGILDIEVLPALRRKGLAKHLLGQMVRHLRQQQFQFLEAQVDLESTALLGLLGGLDFRQVESGHCYRRAMS